MAYSVTFKVNLLKNHDGNYCQNDSEINSIILSKSVYLPVGISTGSPSWTGKHGDTFTLYGLQAAYLRKLITTGIVGDIEVDSINVPQEDHEEVSYKLFITTSNHPLFGLYPIEIDDNGLTTGEYIGSLINDDADIYSGTACYNPDDGFVYFAWIGTGDEFKFHKVNLNTFEITAISVGSLEEGANDVSSLTYLGDNTFLLFSNDALYSITSSGTITVISTINDDFVYGFVNTICYHNGVLYGAGESSKLLTINPETGETQNDIEQKMYISWAGDESGDIYAVDNLCSMNGNLYATLYVNWIPYLGLINTDEFTVTLVDNNKIDDDTNGMFVIPYSESITSLGFSTPEYVEPHSWYTISGGEITFSLLKNNAPHGLTSDDLYIEWMLYGNFPNEAEWSDIDFEITYDDEEHYEITILAPSESEMIFRMRLVNDVSGNWYYIRYD